MALRPFLLEKVSFFITKMKRIYFLIEITDKSYSTHLESFNILFEPIEVENKQEPVKISIC